MEGLWGYEEVWVVDVCGGGVMGGEVALGGCAVFGAHFVHEAYGGFVV